MNVIISVDYTIPSVSILIRFSDYGYGCISRAQLFKSIKLPFKNIFLFARRSIPDIYRRTILYMYYPLLNRTILSLIPGIR